MSSATAPSDLENRELRSRLAMTEVAASLTVAIEQHHGFTTMPLAPDKWHFTRVYRPRWMTWVGWCAVPLAGVGVVLLCQRRIESFVMLLAPRHDGTSVAVGAGAPAEVLRTISLTLAPPSTAWEMTTSITDLQDLTVVAADWDRGDDSATVYQSVDDHTSVSPSAPNVANWAPPTSESLPEATVAEAPWATDYLTSMETSTAFAVSAPDDSGTLFAGDIENIRSQIEAVIWRVLFDTGEVADVTGVVMVGREPAPMSETDQLVAIDDPNRSVSRTHFALLLEAGTVWLQDVGSANGTGVMRHGELFEVRIGDRFPLQSDDQIVFGQRRARIKAK